MATVTLGVKVDEALRERLRVLAESLGCTPHWLHKQALLSYIEAIERGQVPAEIDRRADADSTEASAVEPEPLAPFHEFAQEVLPQSVLRAAITAAYRRPEPECVAMLVDQAESSQPERVETLARRLVQTLRDKRKGGGVEGLIQEFSLSSQEGVALMCLAEALLRIPDQATRDALIRDKISHGDWRAHLGHSPSLFVNAATWGLLLTGKLVSTHNETGLTSSLTRIIGKSGEPMIRKGVDMAMRLMGEQFVTGQTISSALANSRKFEDIGFRYSYDMLGEAATTAEDAARYYQSYEQAIHAIGKASQGRGIYEGPGISIKLSALHPRYSRAQRDRVMEELLPRMVGLAALARRYDIGLNIDAEEADRLELSLDLLEALCFDERLRGWNGIGFVIQAYQKRAPFVIDFVIDLARRSKHRLMVRLVKGAYWDSEVKRAQVDGLEGYPVYTRKIHTDVSYLACARKLLSAPEAVFPQFATHNAQTLASIYYMAGENYYPGQYEFQCLHGMGEPLYEEVVGPVSKGRLNRPCRVYAPVGTHETLLAYLVRRLLENGANTSFVNRIGDLAVPVGELVQDPVQEVMRIAQEEGQLGAPHPRIPLPIDLFAGQGVLARANSQGLNLANEQRLASLAVALLQSTSRPWFAAPPGVPAPADPAQAQGWEPVRNPAELSDTVGWVCEASAQEVDAAAQRAAQALPIWAGLPPTGRADVLLRTADLLEQRGQTLMGLIQREAGKTLASALGEVREAADFLRYYGTQAAAHFDNAAQRPLGVVLAISPWNFPLAIFTGQIAAALAAGNAVLAKPAEQTPLTAAAMAAIFHEAGLPQDALQLLPGRGETVGAALVAHPQVAGVMFTGSTDVARLINRQLATRLSSSGRVIPLIAETGGQNAMVVDSSALAEQVVLDVLTSAFDSAGQRCSALRLLCLQEDVAERQLAMLKAGLQEWCMGNPDRLATDIGPVIDEAARAQIESHIEAMQAAGQKVTRLHQSAGNGHFVPPAIIELDSAARLTREVFGPVLHVLRYRREQLDELIDEINASGYGLTFGVHSRIDETIDHLTDRVRAGNVYVNRNIIGAVVGVQPFGGMGLSGTGPKAGGPLYLYRLVQGEPGDALALLPRAQSAEPAPQAPLLRQLQGARLPEVDAAQAGTLLEAALHAARLHERWVLPGPTGESNVYRLLPRGPVWAVPATALGLVAQVAAALASGNPCHVVLPEGDAACAALWQALRGALGEAGEPWLRQASGQDIGNAARPMAALLFEGDGDALAQILGDVAARDGALVRVESRASFELQSGRGYDLAALVHEQSISTNTAAAGGNAQLMTMA